MIKTQNNQVKRILKIDYEVNHKLSYEQYLQNQDTKELDQIISDQVKGSIDFFFYWLLRDTHFSRIVWEKLSVLFQNDIEEVFSFKTLPDFATQKNQDMLHNELDRIKCHLTNNSYFADKNKMKAPMFWEGFGMLWGWDNLSEWDEPWVSDDQDYFNASMDQSFIPNRRFVHLFLLCVISPSDIYIVSDANCNHYTICDSVEVVAKIWYCWFVFNASKAFDEYIPSDIANFVTEYHLEHTEWDYWMMLQELKKYNFFVEKLSKVNLNIKMRKSWPTFWVLSWKTNDLDKEKWKKELWEHFYTKEHYWDHWKLEWLEIEKNIKIEKPLDNDISEQ